MAISVLVVEDDAFTRMLLQGQLESLGYEVSGVAESVTQALEVARVHRPEVALLDLDLGRGPTGIDLAHGLRDIDSRMGIVLLTSYVDTRLVGTSRPLPTGCGLIVKRALEDPSQLDGALTAAARNPLGDGVTEIPADAPNLSDGQVEILRLVANGFSNAEIARRRHLSESAVIKALARLIDQIGIKPEPGDNQRVLLTQAYFQLTGTSKERRG
jgi:DNA-binding NarL/FixJ family response regulator